MNPRDIIRDLPLADVEHMLIMRAVARGLSAPVRAIMLKQLGIIVPQHSEDAGQPYDGMKQR